ncbi:MAG: hypothetical protein K2P99_03720 [Burkholderiales bacterium]|nr:hypothetical protein [Burkholderiales bacterium]
MTIYCWVGIKMILDSCTDIVNYLNNNFHDEIVQIKLNKKKNILENIVDIDSDTKNTMLLKLIEHQIQQVINKMQSSIDAVIKDFDLIDNMASDEFLPDMLDDYFTRLTDIVAYLTYKSVNKKLNVIQKGVAV